MGPFAGVGVLGLDALASASYGPEALLTALIPLGQGGLGYLAPLVICTLGLLTIVGLSYGQTIPAYPSGGGAYTVAKENLGTRMSLLAAAALALDYVLNAAVAVSAGVGALVSALPSLLPYTLPLCLGVLLILALLNLRGVRATGVALLLPTYAFVAALVLVILIGIFKTITSDGLPAPIVAPVGVTGGALSSAPLWLLMHAFANGCTAMTGVEAVSNGVPIFRKPEAREARRALALIVTILMVLLAGVGFLCHAYRVTATVPGREGYQSVLSQIIAATTGRGAFYYVAISCVIAVLALSANTSFADFPRVCRILAGDGYLPETFMHRGRRLAFSHGIIVLTLLAGTLLIVFDGVTEGLIPLFAIGALSAFTLSQAGMTAHWRRVSGPHARRKSILNLVGACATGATLVVVFIAKFEEGAWISLFLVAVAFTLFRSVRRHYDFVARATSTDAKLVPAPNPVAVVPLRQWDAVSLKALRFALGTAPEVIALQVLTGNPDEHDLSGRWDNLVSPVTAAGLPPPKLVVLHSEYRQLIGPLLRFVDGLAKEKPERQIAVIIPELMEARWYQRLLHNHTASLLRTLLLLRGGPQMTVVSVPWYLRDWVPERQRLAASHPLSRRSWQLARAKLWKRRR